MEGLLSTGPTLSSLIKNSNLFLIDIYIIKLKKRKLKKGTIEFDYLITPHKFGLDKLENK